MLTSIPRSLHCCILQVEEEPPNPINPAPLYAPVGKDLSNLYSLEEVIAPSNAHTLTQGHWKHEKSRKPDTIKLIK